MEEVKSLSWITASPLVGSEENIICMTSEGDENFLGDYSGGRLTF